MHFAPDKRTFRFFSHQSVELVADSYGSCSSTLFITWNRTSLLYWTCMFFFSSPLCYFKIILYNLTKSVAFCLLDRLMQKAQQRMFFWMSASQLTLSWKRKKQHFQQKRSSGVCTASRVHVAAMNKTLLKAILLSWEVSGICACGMLFWTKSSPLFRQHTQ